jgi:hypothetical protein
MTNADNFTESMAIYFHHEWSLDPKQLGCKGHHRRSMVGMSPLIFRSFFFLSHMLEDNIASAKQH